MESNGSVRIIGGIVLLVVAIAGYVAVLGVGGDVADYRGLITLIVVPTCSVLFVTGAAGSVKRDVKENTAKLEKVEKQTNGALSAKFDEVIEQAVDRALAKHKEDTQY